MSAEDDGTQDAHARSEMYCSRRAALMLGCCPECWEPLVRRMEVAGSEPREAVLPRARFTWYCPACSWEEELAHGH